MRSLSKVLVALLLVLGTGAGLTFGADAQNRYTSVAARSRPATTPRPGSPTTAGGASTRQAPLKRGAVQQAALGGTLRNTRRSDLDSVGGDTSRALGSIEERAWTRFQSAETNSARASWVRVYPQGQAGRLVQAAVARARTALGHGSTSGLRGVHVEDREGATFITVDMGESTGTVERRPPAAGTPQQNARPSRGPQQVRHITLVLDRGRVSSAYPSLPPFNTAQSTQRAGEMNERALSNSSGPTPLAERAVRTYLRPNPAPYRQGSQGRTAANMEPRRHAVFLGGEAGAAAAVDAAWRRAQQVYAARLTGEGGVTMRETRNASEITSSDVEIENGPDGTTFITVNMGHAVGTISGRMGEALEHMEADHIQMLVSNGQIANAIPISMGPQAQRFTGGPTVGPAERRHTLPAGAAVGRVTRPANALRLSEVGQRLVQRMAPRGANARQRESAEAIALRNTQGENLEELPVEQRLATPARNVMLGLPTRAARGTQEEIVVRNGFVSAMRQGVGVTWVSYSAGGESVAPTPVERQEDFRVDPTLPEAMRGRDEEFGELSIINFHRGHMFSAGIANQTARNNSATFTYANVIPQAALNNTGPWNGLEQYERLLIRQGFRVHVMAGALYLGNSPSINGRIRIPSHTWKVVVMADRNGRITDRSRVMAIVVPNNNHEVKQDDHWTDYRVTPETIEALSARPDNAGGALTFFDHLPTAMANAFRTQIDTRPVSAALQGMRSFLPTAIEETFRPGRQQVQPHERGPAPTTAAQ